MNNRIKIAYEFAHAIESENIIRIILFGSVARVMIKKILILIF